MECQQRQLFEHEIALMKGLEDAAGNHGTDTSFKAAVKHVAAMYLGKLTDMKLSDFQWETPRALLQLEWESGRMRAKVTYQLPMQE